MVYSYSVYSLSAIIIFITCFSQAMALSILSLIVLIQIFFHSGECVIIYNINSFQNKECSMENCMSLSELSANFSENDNATLIFQTGNHHLNVIIEFSNITELKLLSESSASIVCQLSSRFVFDTIKIIHMRNVVFIGCGGNSVKNVNEFYIKNITFIGQNESETSLTLTNTTAEIINSSFVGNQYGTVMEGVSSIKLIHTNVSWLLVRDVTDTVRVGGALIASHSNVNISNSKFENNKAEVGGEIFTEDSSNFLISNSTFSGEGLLSNEPEPPFGGSIFAHKGDVLIENCLFQAKTATVGGVIVSSLSTFKIYDSNFISNSASDHGAVLFAYDSHVLIHRCNFENTIAGACAGITTQEVIIQINESRFIENRAERHAGALEFYLSYPMITGCMFINNSADSFAGAILFWHSTGHLYGKISSRNEENKS